MTGSPLVQKASDAETLSAAINFVLGKHSQKMESCLPAAVVAYDDKQNIATLQPLIMQTVIDQDTGLTKAISRPQLVEVPVLSLGAGNFHIHFPIGQGDLGWIHAADRDINLFMQTLAEAKAPSNRCHSFNDAVFVPDVLRNYTLNDEDSGAMVIQSTDGATRISIRSDNIKVTAPTKVTVDSPDAFFTGNVHVAGDTKIEGNTDITGNTTVTGNTVVAGATALNGGLSAAPGKPCTLPATATVNGKSIDTHTHLAIAIGSQTGGMV